ncbi:hypothetical protein MMC11_005290 [Xylographa trunciseda]|nr:hypothetical protein [Xylographa trunciseda]
MEKIIYNDSPLGIQVLHTPGHTPDELAWYDEAERHLFVGDSFYERVAADKSYTQAIIFPKEGDIIVYMQSLEKLLRFVQQENRFHNNSDVRVGCGHVTSRTDGLDVLKEVQRYFWEVIDGIIPVRESSEKRGEMHDLWQKDGDARFSLIGPRRLVADARRHYGRGPSVDASFVIM